MPFAVTLLCPLETADLLLADFGDFETSGIEQTDQASQTRFTAHFQARGEAERFASHFAAFTPRTEEIAERNWAEEWQAQWRPIEVGRRFYLAPSWMDTPAPEGRLRLEMRPGLVFGGGDHPTTQLCLELLEEYLRPGQAMADIGCGSGILTDGAHALGAGKLIACDIDANAAEAAGRILASLARPAAVYRGSVDAVRGESVDVVAANLLTGVVVGLLPEFARVLKQGGLLIASGFLATQQDLITGRAHEQGLRMVEPRVKGDWAAAVMERL